MFTPANIGIAIAILSVVAAYWIGYTSGFARGKDRGFGDGKRVGAEESSMPGFAAGYKRAKRETGDDEPDAAPGRRFGFGVIALAFAAVMVFYLAARGTKENVSDDRPDATRSAFSRDWPASAPQLRSLDERQPEENGVSLEARANAPDRWETSD
jgi:hypothetical protein